MPTLAASQCFGSGDARPHSVHIRRLFARVRCHIEDSQQRVRKVLLHELRVHDDLIVLAVANILLEPLLQPLGLVRAVPCLTALAGLLAAVIVVVVAHTVAVAGIDAKEAIERRRREHEACGRTQGEGIG